MAELMTGNEVWGRTLREMGIASGEALFSDARVAVWRKMAERENGVLETPGGRLHVKRYLTASGVREAGKELMASQLLR